MLAGASADTSETYLQPYVLTSKNTKQLSHSLSVQILFFVHSLLFFSKLKIEGNFDKISIRWLPEIRATTLYIYLAILNKNSWVEARNSGSYPPTVNPNKNS